MMVEDYCSFETALALKEKGFDEACLHYYRTETTLGKTYTNLSFTDEYLHNSEIKYGAYKGCECTAPTLQMAMKWLREQYHLAINIDYMGESPTFKYYIYNMEGTDKYTNFKHYDSYEETVEVAIKYCLEHLI